MLQRAVSKYLMIFMTGLTGLLFVRDVMDFYYSKYLLLGYVLLFAVFAKPKILAPMLCFVFPLAWGLPGTYIFLACIFLYWIKRRKIPIPAFLLISSYLLLEIIAAFWYQEWKYTDIVKYISTLSLFFTFLYDEEIDKEQCVKAYYVGSLVLCSIVLISTIQNAPSNWLSLFSRGFFRFGMRYAEEKGRIALSLNANALAYYSLIGFTLAINFITGNKGKKILFHIGACLLFVMTGLLSVTMSFVLVMSICVLLFILSRLQKITTIFYSLLTTLGISLIIAYIIFKMPNILTAFSSRFNSTDIATANYRTTLFMLYNEAFFNNLRFILMGTGVTQYQNVLNITYATHNMIQQILVCYGIFFGMLFFTAILYPLKTIIKNRKTTIIKWIPVISVLLFAQAIQFITPEELMLPYIITVYVLATAPLKKEEQENQSL